MIHRTFCCAVSLLLCMPILPAFAQARTAPATGSATQPTTSPISPHKIAHDTSEGSGGDLAAVVALEKVEDQFTGQERDEWMDALATRLIFVGDHRKAMELNRKAYSQVHGKPV